jgi:hypothetical protein
MLATIMKAVSIVALLAAVLWRPSANLQVLLQITVFAGAAFVIVQCFRDEKWGWGTAFIAMAMLFAAVTTSPPSRAISPWLDVLCLVMFALSAVVVRTQPRLSIASITDRNPGSESL